jgi:hypothetical protein
MNGKLLFGLGLGIIVAAVGVTALMNSATPTASASSPPPAEMYSEPSLPAGWTCVVVIQEASVEGSNICSAHGKAYAYDSAPYAPPNGGGYNGGGETNGAGYTKTTYEDNTQCVAVGVVAVNACDFLNDNKVLSDNEVFSRNGEVEIFEDIIEDSTVIVLGGGAPLNGIPR